MPTLLQNRFLLQKLLGEGAQGKVWLAQDTRLERQVAVKQLRATAYNAAQTRLASRLQHANIVTLHDAFDADNEHWVVFEYVQGQTLAALLKRDGRIPAARAVDIAIGILDGLSVAHAQGVIHRDIKPQNIMLDAENRPRIMDFGIAAARGSQVGAQGTAAYMAPEVINNLPADAQADIFAVGMTLYRMLTGQQAVDGESAWAVMYRIATQPIAAPSTIEAGVNEKLDHLVMVALFKDPRERFTDAAAMSEALKVWKGEVAAQSEHDATQSTLDFLLRRMRHTSDFPALSQAISAINKINESDSERLQVLSGVILDDFSLVNKLLRIVNSASYGQFGGTISTISRAIVILGFDTIRNLAITLLLFEHMHNKAQANKLKEAVLRAFFGGVLSREIGRKAGARDTEEALICGMFHHLGKLLTVYYFPEEQQEIARKVEGGAKEDQAVVAVLGLSYDELGIGIARHWLFPDRIINAMRPLPEGMPRAPNSQNERLRVYANLSARLVPMVGMPAGEQSKQMAVLLRQYGSATGLGARELQDVLRSSADILYSHLGAIGVDARNSVFLRQLAKQNDRGLAPPSPSDAGHGDALEDAVLHNDVEQDAASVLSAGVQDITNTLVGTFNLNDVLRMILETMYRGVGFERVLFCTRDAKKPIMLARFGFGSDVAGIVPLFQLDTTRSGDVFQVALERNLDILIDDIDAPTIADRVPAWYRDNIPAASFIIFPLKVGDRMIGFFYGDKLEAGSLKFGNNELNMLKTLRNQAILAIRTKQAGG